MCGLGCAPNPTRVCSACSTARMYNLHSLAVGGLTYTLRDFTEEPVAVAVAATSDPSGKDVKFRRIAPGLFAPCTGVSERVICTGLRGLATPSSTSQSFSRCHPTRWKGRGLSRPVARTDTCALAMLLDPSFSAPHFGFSSAPRFASSLRLYSE